MVKYIIIGKSLCTTIFIFICINSLSQTNSPTLHETQLWVKDIIENYGVKGNLVNYYYSVDFSKNGLLIITENQNWRGSKNPQISEYTVPIKLMEKVQYEFRDINVLVWIKCKSSVNGKVFNPIITKSFGNDRFIEGENISGITLLFNISFKENDLPNRFVKAINHLIELNGGEIVKEVF